MNMDSAELLLKTTIQHILQLPPAEMAICGQKECWSLKRCIKKQQHALVWGHTIQNLCIDSVDRLWFVFKDSSFLELANVYQAEWWLERGQFHFRDQYLTSCSYGKHRKRERESERERERGREREGERKIEEVGAGETETDFEVISFARKWRCSGVSISALFLCLLPWGYQLWISSIDQFSLLSVPLILDTPCHCTVNTLHSDSITIPSNGICWQCAQHQQHHPLRPSISWMK